jgi:SAM-dependent methyltransferase
MLSRRVVLLAPVVAWLRGQERQGKMFGDAEAYERFMGRWSRLVAPRFAAFAALPEGGRILDVGSGTGALAFSIAELDRKARVLGIDPSAEYVAYAMSRNRFGDRASFEVGDAQQLRFPDASFDGAVSLLVFNFIPDAKKALLELRRVTKPGRAIAAAVWDYGAGMRMLRVFWDAAVQMDPAAEKLDEKHMPLCRAGELSALWKQGGLRDVREQAIEITMRFASFSDYWEPFLLGQGPAGAYARRLDGDKLRALRSEVKRRLASPESASLDLTARVWCVLGNCPDSHKRHA